MKTSIERRSPSTKKGRSTGVRCGRLVGCREIVFSGVPTKKESLAMKAGLAAIQYLETPAGKITIRIIKHQLQVEKLRRRLLKMRAPNGAGQPRPAERT